MEIDPLPDTWSSTSGAELALVPPGIVSRLPLIDESFAVGLQAPKDRLMGVLEAVEVRVERLRRDAVHIEDEKDALLSTLDSVKQSELLADVPASEVEDVSRYVERILARALTVEVSVRTERDVQQEEALHQVNVYIDALVMSVREDATGAHARCRTFMAACSSYDDAAGPADKPFETAILGCTLDDQKRVKRRLQGLLHYFARLNVTSCT